MSLKSVNPTTGDLLNTYQELTLKEAIDLVEVGHTAFKSWKNTNFDIRSKHMKAAAQILKTKKQRLAELMAREMGKPVTQGIKEIEKCAGACEYFAQHSENFLRPEIILTDAPKSYITYEPLGAILAIMPWNYPFWQAFRAAIPALMAGNTMVLKHSSNVSGCALAIEEIFKEAGFPEGVFKTLLITSKTALSLIENKYIQGITLTGSTAAGQSVAAKAGQFLKKCVLELGGSDPYLILEDANLEEAAKICATSRLQNSGQSCIAAKRFIVIENVQEQFTEHLVKYMKQAVIGDPLLEETIMGPLARLDLREALHQQVQQSIKKGAVCLLGGISPEGPGAFYPPTILTNIKKGMSAYEEELFGPVASIIKAKDEQEAIFIANNTSFGLGAAVFTQNLKKGEHIASKELQAGNCFVNALVKSDAKLPFGGIKESGFGRELSHIGIKEFVNCKVVVLGT